LAGNKRSSSSNQQRRLADNPATVLLLWALVRKAALQPAKDAENIKLSQRPHRPVTNRPRAGNRLPSANTKAKRKAAPNRLRQLRNNFRITNSPGFTGAVCVDRRSDQRSSAI